MTLKQHVDILLIKASTSASEIARRLEVSRAMVTHITNGFRRSPGLREQLFEILRERLPEEVREYSDVWIDEKPEAAEKDAA